MNATGLTHCFRLLLAAGLTLLAASCSTKTTGGGATIYKVNTYHLANLNPSKPVSDPSIPFERSYRLHGAINRVEQVERLGNYLTVFWKISDRTQPVTVRLEYRQKKTGLAVKTIEQVIEQPRRKNVTEFAFTGDNYTVNGPITSWRASIVRDGQVLVTYDSYLWQ